MTAAAPSAATTEKRLLLLMATRTYRARAFMRAARRLGARVVVGSERRQALAVAGGTLALDFRHPDRAVEQIAAAAARAGPFDAVIGVDDDSTLLAAMAAEALGLPHNAVAAVRATRDKLLMRELLERAGVPAPWYQVVSLDDDPALVAARVAYPCVLKPVHLSASRGVIRADTPAEFVAAVARIRAILAEPELAATAGENARRLLVEAFIPGVEVALEGMLTDGALKVLALFDKPDPLDGPFFEETIYVTPSRLPDAAQAEIAAMAARGAAALGLREGPVHAELRLNADGPWIVEIAARSIGGLCSDTLEFGGGLSLEDLILLHATGSEIARYERTPEPSGVIMLPIPTAGVLRAVDGVEAARATPGVVDLSLSIPIGDAVIPLPEGNRYLGFLFARGPTPAAVESTLRAAAARLTFDIRPSDG